MIDGVVYGACLKILQGPGRWKFRGEVIRIDSLTWPRPETRNSVDGDVTSQAWPAKQSAAAFDISYFKGCFHLGVRYGDDGVAEAGGTSQGCYPEADPFISRTAPVSSCTRKARQVPLLGLAS